MSVRHTVNTSKTTRLCTPIPVVRRIVVWMSTDQILKKEILQLMSIRVDWWRHLTKQRSSSIKCIARRHVVEITGALFETIGARKYGQSFHNRQDFAAQMPNKFYTNNEKQIVVEKHVYFWLWPEVDWGEEKSVPGFFN